MVRLTSLCNFLWHLVRFVLANDLKPKGLKCDVIFYSHHIYFDKSACKNRWTHRFLTDYINFLDRCGLEWHFFARPYCDKKFVFPARKTTTFDRDYAIDCIHDYMASWTQRVFAVEFPLGRSRRLKTAFEVEIRRLSPKIVIGIELDRQLCQVCKISRVKTLDIAHGIRATYKSLYYFLRVD